MDMENNKFYDIVHNKELSFAEETEKLVINKTTLAKTIYPDFYEIIMQEYLNTIHVSSFIEILCILRKAPN